MIEASCVFCKIVRNQAEASIVYQDESVSAFMDAFPVNPGHTLVVPNQHSPDLAGLTDPDAGEMIRLAKRVAGALRASDLRCEAVSLLLSDGSAAGQEIFHVHLHVIPRYVGDSCGLRLHLMPPGRPERTVLDEQAAVLKDILHG